MSDEVRRDDVKHWLCEPPYAGGLFDDETAAKAWDEGYWQGINGHTGPGNPYRDKDDIVNRKAVQS